MHIFYNPNPNASRVGDCTIRALCKATGQDWDKTYVELCVQGLIDKDMPSSNHVWGNYLKSKGFKRKMIPEDCYTVKDFCRDHPKGLYILAISGHVVCAENGNHFDTWNSCDEIVLYYWEK